jgi:hypothetical protein
MGLITELPMIDGRAWVRLCAELTPEWKESVEELLFFNSQQAQIEKQILESIQAFGLPRVVLHDGVLRIVVGGSIVVGTLFALVNQGDAEQLAGLLLFLRRANELICVHLSIDELFTMRGPYAELKVTVCLLDELRHIGTRIAGVEYMAIYYKRNGWYRLPLSTKLL